MLKRNRLSSFVFAYHRPSNSSNYLVYFMTVLNFGKTGICQGYLKLVKAEGGDSILAILCSDE